MSIEAIDRSVGMKIVTNDSEAKLLEVINGLKEDPSGYYALNFNLSQLTPEYRSEYQIKITLNILNDLFKGLDSIAFAMKDCDVVLLYNGTNRGLLEKAIFQIRYLFMDDPLGYGPDGLENEDLCTVYDLEFQWRDFYNYCLSRNGNEIVHDHHVPSDEITTISGGKRQKLHVFTIENLVKIINTIQKTNVSGALRSQPVCAFVQGREPKIIFSENYINIPHLLHLVNFDVDIFSNMSLFKYLTKLLDKHVLSSLEQNVSNDNFFPASINLNVSTLFSEEFASFDLALNAQKKKSTLIEIHVSDVFEDIHKFVAAMETVQSLGYRVCIDGLDGLAFAQIDRRILGFDLAKVQWSEALGAKDGKDTRAMLAEAVKKCDPKRVILCRCDTEEAVEYGKSIGISLFQGRYIDKLLNPDSKITN